MKEISQIVVRRSGIWNSRAPYHTYLVEQSVIRRDHNLQTLAVLRTRYDAHKTEATSSTNVIKFMRADVAGAVSRKFWQDYRDYWRIKTGRTSEQPTLDDLKRDLANSLSAIREYAVIRWSSAFEAFTQCWALNMLLAHLEGSGKLSESEQRLLHQMSPIRSPNRPAPGVPGILRCYDNVRTELDALPHVNTDPHTGVRVTKPMHPELTALRSIQFWREYRNVLVHRGGRVSGAFLDTHGKFFEAFRRNYSEVMRELKATGRLQLPSMIVPAVSTTHTKAARWMNEVLVRESSGTRGKLRPPSEEEPEKLDLALLSPPLLKTGDHSGSVEWIQNASLREEVLRLLQ